MTISKACKRLLVSEPFYGYFMLNLIKRETTTETDTLGVMLQGTNIHLVINPEFWNSLLDHQQIAVLKHEMMHVCMHHLIHRSSYADHNIFNIAADCEINQYIKDIPENCIKRDSLSEQLGVDLEPFAGTKYYYKQIYNNREKLDLNIPMSGCGDHDLWKNIDTLSDVEKKIITKQIEGQMMRAAESTVKSRGTIPGELTVKIKELFKINAPIFNWRVYFRRLIGSAFQTYTKKSLRKLSKRFKGSAGVKIKQRHHILVGIDTSASVSNKELVEFFSELTHMYKAGVDITVVECDTKINKIYKYTGKYTGNISGRGGTYFEPVIEMFNANLNKYSVLVYFTDGEASIDIKPKKDMLWVLTSNGHYDVNQFPGKTIVIPKK